MNAYDAMRILQHASDYIFFTRVVRHCGSTDERAATWEVMTILLACRNSLQKDLWGQTNTLALPKPRKSRQSTKTA